jgi:hypothetical protein
MKMRSGPVDCRVSPAMTAESLQIVPGVLGAIYARAVRRFADISRFSPLGALFRFQAQDVGDDVGAFLGVEHDVWHGLM